MLAHCAIFACVWVFTIPFVLGEINHLQPGHLRENHRPHKQRTHDGQCESLIGLVLDATSTTCASALGTLSL